MQVGATVPVLAAVLDVVVGQVMVLVQVEGVAQEQGRAMVPVLAEGVAQDLVCALDQLLGWIRADGRLAQVEGENLVPHSKLDP